MKLIIDTRGFSPVLVLVVISAVLVATVFLSSSIKSVLDVALAATQLEKGATFNGIIFKGTANRCQAKTDYAFCYKLFQSNGEPAIWVRPSAGLSKTFESFVGKRVNIKANKLEYTPPSNTSITVEMLPVKDKIYYNVKSLTLSPSDYAVNFGIGGLGSGQGPEDRAELGVHSMNPGIYWSAIQPNANTTVAEMRANLARYLDGTQQECKQKGMDCGIFIGGLPKYAVTQGLAKYKATNNKDLVCSGNDYPFPLDNNFVVPFANFVSEVAERYDGDGLNDAPGSPKASYIMLFNEVDWKDVNYTGCGDAMFNTNKDLNNNKTADYIDYANMMEEVWRKVKTASSGKVALATSRYAAADNTSRKFIEDVMAYQYNKYPTNKQVFFDTFAMNYYDNHRDDAPFADSYSKGTRGKVNWAENLMKKYGGVKPIVFTEIGYDAKTTNDYPEQALRLVKIFAQAFSKESVQEVNWFTLYSNKFWHCCALIDTFNKESVPLSVPVRRPAFNAFKTMQKLLGNTKFLTLEMADPKYIEGYIFVDPVTAKRKEVVWYNKRNPNDPEKTIIFDIKRVSNIKVTKPDGSFVEIKDNTGSDRNTSLKTIGIELTGAPVILEFTDGGDLDPI